MMQIIETRERDVTDLLKLRYSIDQYFGCRTGVENITNYRAAVKMGGWVIACACFWRALIFDAGLYLPGFRIDFNNESSVIQVPLVLSGGFIQSRLSLSSPKNVKFGHTPRTSS